LKTLVYFVAIWSILQLHIYYNLWPFGIFDGYLVYSSRFGMLYQEKYGNPGRIYSYKYTIAYAQFKTQEPKSYDFGI
jgi:hypothetical protein